MVIRDPYSLTDKQDEEITLNHLKRVESAQILIVSYDGVRDKQKLTCFLENGDVCKLANTDVLNKIWKELEYIHKLLEVKNEATQKWSEFIRKTMTDKRDLMR